MKRTDGCVLLFFTYDAIEYCQFTRGPAGWSKLAFNPISNDQYLVLSKMKEFEHDKFNVTKIRKFSFRRVENMVGKSENVDYRHFLLFPPCFENVVSSGAS